MSTIQTQRRETAESPLVRRLSSIVPLTLSTLADLLGMTLEHVSRLMQRLRRSGLVRTDRDRTEFVDIDALAKECDFDPSYRHRSERPKPLQPQPTLVHGAHRPKSARYPKSS